MKTLLNSITGTNNIIVNTIITITLSFIAFTLIVLVCNLFTDPSLIVNASF